MSEEVTMENIKEFFGSLRGRMGSFVLPLVFIVVAVGLFAGVAVPGITRIQSLRNERTELESTLEELNSKVDELNALSVRKGELDEVHVLLETALPSEAKVPQLMTQLQTMTEESNVLLEILRYSGQAGSGGKDSLSEVKLQMKVTGGFSEMQTFLETIEQASRIVGADRLALSLDTSMETASMSATLGVHSYFLPEITEQDVAAPLSFSLDDRSFQEKLEKMEALKMYEVTVVEGELGKENPFIR